MGTNTTDNRDTAPCTKCTSEIPTAAERCPQCGYEPGPGILGGIVMWVSLMLGGTFLTITITAPIVILDGYPLLDLLPAVGFTGFIALVFLTIVYLNIKNGQRGPTDPYLNETTNDDTDPSTDSKTISESWQDGAQRGEQWADNAGNRFYAILNALPGTLWTVGVLLGCVLSLSLWPATAQQNETAMMFGVVGGGLLLFFTVLIDIYRLNHQHDDLQFRWWFWSLLSFIPLFGWIFGFAWLARKRQKTGGWV